MIDRIKIYSYVFLIGAVLYSTIEVAYRGYTHWTMMLTGGIVFSMIYLINIKIKTKSLLARTLVGAVVITATELAVGIVVNIFLNMNVWDYSNQPLNFLGQICPVFSCVWFIISIPATYLALFMSEKLEQNTL